MFNLIRVLFNNIIYNKYIDIIKPLLDTNTKEVILLYKYLEELHTKYNRDITYEEYVLYVLSRIQEKDKENISGLLELLKEPTSIVLEDTLQELEKKQRAYDLAKVAIAVSEGQTDFSELLVSAESLIGSKVDSVVSEDIFVTNDLSVLHDIAVKNHGLRWRLKTLNTMLGSLRKGDFGFIFARPETGKTTFMASEVSFFATQVDRPILWFNNEEDGQKVQLRIYQSVLGVTLTELFADVPGNNKKFAELGGNYIKVYDSAAIHKSQVERLVKEMNPSLIIFDQIDKIKGFSDDREDLRLGAIYIWARELAKTHCPVIGVCQADASGEGKKWLTMENVANAKTAKQAEADWILGIGKTHIDSEEFVRYLHLSKNKLSGDEDSNPDLRHGRQQVFIQPEIARYGDY